MVQFVAKRAFLAMRNRLAVLLVLLVAPLLVRGQPASSPDQLVRQFESETVFWKQFQVAQAIVAARDPKVLPKLEPWLTREDRHLRGNAAFVFASLGDPRGFDVIVAMLSDRSERRAIPILGPLLTDPDVNYIVPWSPGQIGNESAIPPLIGELNDPNPSLRVLAIYALVDLNATEALPRLRQLLDDHEKSNFGKLESVAEAAQAAIARFK